MATYDEIINLPNTPEKMLIDVRNPSELEETGTIPTSINIPLPDLENALSMTDSQFKEKYNAEKPDENKVIIFSCKLGGRAQKATDLAQILGFKNAKCYKGSWTEWAKNQGL